MRIYNYMKSQLFLQITLFVFAVINPAVAIAQDITRPQPEIATGITQVQSATANNFMAVTANPYATEAAYNILKKGGSAVDAAITAQLVLGLVEPQSSGIGGGAFMLHYDAASKELVTYDGRETAPALIGPFMFQKEGKPMNFMEAVIGGRAVGVPGVPMLLKDAHQAHGKLTWMELFDEPIQIAKEGFTVSPRLASMVKEAAERLNTFQNTAQYFLPKGKPIQAGQTLKNPEYENTLRDFAFYGPQIFYQGTRVHQTVSLVQTIEDNPGLLTAQDFAAYQIKKRDPVCGPYRAYIVCSMAEPSSGGLTTLQTLALLEGFDLAQQTPETFATIAQASALAFADRGAYMADPDFVNTPGVALLEPEYIKSRRALIDPSKPLTDIHAGAPPSWNGSLYQKGFDIDKPSTTHISIIDANGNIVSMTSSIEGAFGSHVMVDGYLLNNQLTDFSFAPIRDKQLIANMAEPGKRPRSSMAPTIVFDAAGAPVLVVGSAGGSRIIGYVLEQIITKIDWGMSAEEAMARPHTLARNSKIETEDEAIARPLRQLGYTVETKPLTSGLTAIHIQGDNYSGTADPRREGTAKGQEERTLIR